MGVRLDWQIEAENLYDRAGEDPELKRRRRLLRLRVILLISAVAVVVCGIVGAIWLRLYTVDNQIRQSLVDTVQAETAMIRIGDFAGFIALQRSAGADWISVQSKRFKDYQTLKAKTTVDLSGKVLDTTIDGLRGRALIEETIDGVVYHTLWFYWQYGKDGWRHVPSDYTFWGDPQTITGKVTSVSFHGLDEPMATTLAGRVDQWWQDGCKTLSGGACDASSLPMLKIKVVPDPAVQLKWDENQSDTLIVPSPLASSDRARADSVIPSALEEAVAIKVADRVFERANPTLKPSPIADASWLRQTTVEWLAGSFVGRGDLTRLGFIQSIKDKYGATALAALARSLTSDTDISVISKAIGQPMESLAVDWRAFFQWRLDLEKTLLSKNNQAGFQALWDAANPQVAPAMQARLKSATQAAPQIQSLAVSPAADGVLQATVQATLEGNPVVVMFRLVNGTWKRAA